MCVDDMCQFSSLVLKPKFLMQNTEIDRMHTNRASWYTLQGRCAHA